MPVISAAATSPGLETLTRQKVLERHLRETKFGEYGTVTSGSTTTLLDTTKLKSTQFSADEKTGAWARISIDAGGAAAAPELEISPVTTYAPSTGTITFNPAMTVAPAAGDVYQLWRYVHPQEVLDTLDQILQNDWFAPDWTILSECPDYDMEQTHTTDWTASNATLTKQTAEPLMFGKRYLRVVATAANAYAGSVAMKVIPGRKYHVSAISRASAAATTARLNIYDATNSASIDTVDTTSQVGVRIWKEVTVPATCYRLTVRLTTVEDTMTTEWDEVCVYGVDGSDLPLPWWIKGKDQLKGIFRSRQDEAGTGNVWRSIPRLTDDAGRWDIVDRSGRIRIVARQGGITSPIYVFGTRNETAYASEGGDSKRVDANWLAACLNYKMFQQIMAIPNAAQADMAWAEKGAAKWEKEWAKQARLQAQRLQDVVQSESPDGMYYRKEFGFDAPYVVS